MEKILELLHNALALDQAKTEKKEENKTVGHQRAAST